MRPAVRTPRAPAPRTAPAPRAVAPVPRVTTDPAAAARPPLRAPLGCARVDTVDPPPGAADPVDREPPPPPPAPGPLPVAAITVVPVPTPAPDPCPADDTFVPMLLAMAAALPSAAPPSAPTAPIAPPSIGALDPPPAWAAKGTIARTRAGAVKPARPIITDVMIAEVSPCPWPSWTFHRTTEYSRALTGLKAMPASR